MMFRKQAFTLWFFVILLGFAAPSHALDVGEPAPDFRLESLTGEEVNLSDYRGRPVLLKLATTWCPTCKQLSGEISKVDDLLRQNDVAFLEVFVRDSRETVEEYVSSMQHSGTYHALLDDGQVYKAYNVYLIPRLLLIDAEQVVRFDSAGRNVLAEDIAAMLEELTLPATTGGSS